MIVVGSLLVLTACASAPLADRLAFLVDGSTTKEDVLFRLGLPSAEFEGERILTYRIGTGAKRGTVVVPRHAGDWQGAEYSLVLVFDAQQVLRRHALIKVD